MINTPEFQSIERYKKLTEAYTFLTKSPNMHEDWQWLIGPLIEAMTRETNFMLNNKSVWQSQIGAPEGKNNA